MKKVLALLLPFVLCASTAFAFGNYDDDSVVRWKSIDGVITAPNVDNPVGNIHSGTFPWHARSGHASVNLSTGAASFEVEGLVINGAVFSGTPGPISAVTGTLVCNAGDQTQTQTSFDTPAVSLSAHGDARLSESRLPAVLNFRPTGDLTSTMPSERCRWLKQESRREAPLSRLCFTAAASWKRIAGRPLRPLVASRRCYRKVLLTRRGGLHAEPAMDRFSRI